MIRVALRYSRVDGRVIELRGKGWKAMGVRLLCG